MALGTTFTRTPWRTFSLFFQSASAIERCSVECLSLVLAYRAGGHCHGLATHMLFASALGFRATAATTPHAALYAQPPGLLLGRTHPDGSSSALSPAPVPEVDRSAAEPVAVLDAGGDNTDDDEQSEGVGDDEPLAPVDLLPGVVATGVPPYGVGALDRLGVDDPRGGLRVSALGGPELLA